MRCCPQKRETIVLSDELSKDLKHTKYIFAQHGFAPCLPAYEAGVLTTYTKELLKLFII